MNSVEDSSDSGDDDVSTTRPRNKKPKIGRGCQQGVDDASTKDAEEIAATNGRQTTSVDDQNKPRPLQNFDINNMQVKCTACGQQFNHKTNGTFDRHPVLDVLVCKKCYNFYQVGNFDKDENGIDDFCRWCAEGGKLMCCDECTNAFCESCIRRNFGRQKLISIKQMAVWKCFVCDPIQLADNVRLCHDVLECLKRPSLYRGRKPFRSLFAIPPGVPNNPIDSCITKMLKYTQLLQEALLQAKRKNLSAKSLDRRAFVVGKIRRCLREAKDKLQELDDSVEQELSKLTKADDEVKVQNGEVSLNGDCDSSIVVPSKESEVADVKECVSASALPPSLKMPIVSADGSDDLLGQSSRESNCDNAVTEAQVEDSAKAARESSDVEEKPPTSIPLSDVTLKCGDENVFEFPTDVPESGSAIQASDESMISPPRDGPSEVSVKTTAENNSTEASETTISNIDVSNSMGETLEKMVPDEPSADGTLGSIDTSYMSAKSENDVLDSATKLEVLKAPVDEVGPNLSSANFDASPVDSHAKTPEPCLDDYVTEEKTMDDAKVEKHSDKDDTDFDVRTPEEEDEDALAKDALMKMLGDEESSGSEGNENPNSKPSSGPKSRRNGKSVSSEGPLSDRLKSTTIKHSQSSKIPVDSEGSKKHPDSNAVASTSSTDKDNAGTSAGAKSRTKITPKKNAKELMPSRRQKGKSGKHTKVRAKLLFDSSGESAFSSTDDERDSHQTGAREADDDLKTEVPSLNPENVCLPESLTEDSKLFKSEPKVIVCRLDMDVVEDVKVGTIKADTAADFTDGDDTDKELRRILSTKNLKRKNKTSNPSKTGGGSGSGSSKMAPLRKKASLLLFSSDEQDDSSDHSEENSDDDKENRKEQSDPSSPKLVKDQFELKSQEDLAKDSLMALLDSASEDPSAEGDEDDGDNDDDNDDDDDDEAPKKGSKKKAVESEDDSSSEFDRKLKALHTVKNESDSSDDFVPMRKKTRRNCNILNLRLSDSDSKASKTSSKAASKKRKRRPKNTSNESDDSFVSSELSDSSGSMKKRGTKKGKKKVVKRKRIKMADSSDETNSDSDDGNKMISSSQGDTPTNKGRKNIRKLIKDKKLKEGTKQAAREEDDRRKRLAQLQKLYNMVVEEDPLGNKGAIVTKKLVLASDSKTKEPQLEVHSGLICKLKPHQVEGVKFMWESTGETMTRLQNDAGSGCILAHCMGLGKTLQVITYVHTLLMNKNSGINSCLVVCPLNTVLNWASEFNHWLKDTTDEGEEEIEVHFSVFLIACSQVMELTAVKNNFNRAYALKNWIEDGGVMIVSYNMYRNLANENIKRCPKSQRKMFQEALVDPGPDIVICDEGHILKNAKSALSKTMDRIRTARRVILTGTPLQNNLAEYHCMVSFVKPKLLGTMNEFQNRFMNPINNGQCADSTASDVRLMKRRAHILHNLLDGCVQRMDYNVLVPFLPPKQEYVISIKLTELQVMLYRYYLENFARQSGKNCLFLDCQWLSRIWTHPWVLRLGQIREMNKAGNESDNSFINDSRSDTSEDDDIVISGSDDDKKKKKNQPSTSRGRKAALDSGDEEVINSWTTRKRDGKEEEAPLQELEDWKLNGDRPQDEWWSSHLSDEDEFKLELSGKLVILFDILKECEAIGDKVLVFSQSLLSLDLLELMLQHHSKNSREADDNRPRWVPDVDYFRMDGSTAADVRSRYTRIFNDSDNFRARLFLISTKAGCLGINLVSANRVVIFDASWNPTHDVQSIFRVYRFGQEKPVYIYRFLAQGTMEEKIYDRQVTKQSLAIRVLDEQQVDRHFTSADLQELYSFEPDSVSKRPTPMLPKDRLLAELLLRHKELIVNYHEHDSLLMNVQEEELNEEDRKAAWVEYEAERKGIMNGVDITGLAGGNYKFDVTRILEDIQAKYPGLPLDELRDKFSTTIKMLAEAKHKATLQRQQQLQMQQLMQQQFQQQQQQQQQFQQQQQQQEQLRMYQNQMANYRNLSDQTSSNIQYHLANASRNAGIPGRPDGDAAMRPINAQQALFQSVVNSMNAQATNPTAHSTAATSKDPPAYVEIE